MANNNLDYIISMPPSSRINISIVVDHSLGVGSFYRNGIVNFGGQQELLNGFAVENRSVGYLLPPESRTTGVVYIHLDSSENRIRYYADNGAIQDVLILSVPIHDHSSIIQGGPAFGTYYSDYNESSGS